MRGLFWDEPVDIFVFCILDLIPCFILQIQVLVTGGEDSKLNAWKINTIAWDDDEIDSDSEASEWSGMVVE